MSDAPAADEAAGDVQAADAPADAPAPSDAPASDAPASAEVEGTVGGEPVEATGDGTGEPLPPVEDNSAALLGAPTDAAAADVPPQGAPTEADTEAAQAAADVAAEHPEPQVVGAAVVQDNVSDPGTQTTHQLDPSGEVANTTEHHHVEETVVETVDVEVEET